MDSSGVGPPSLPSRGEAARASAVVLGKLFGETVEIAGRYRLGEQIGRGGLGFVHRARDLKLDRDVALKFPKGASANPEIVADLEREAKVLARLQHPNIVAVYDVGQSEQGVYLAMELIDGVSMSEWLAEGRTWTEVLSVMLDAGRGLAVAHDAGVVHRDFKPSNVMIDHGGRVRVVDFGLARQVALDWSDDSVSSSDPHKTSAAGTLPYMAPEQFNGEVSAQSDQFAFCTALYEGICGERPWKEHSRGLRAGEAQQRRVEDELREQGVPDATRRAIRRGLSEDARDRFSGMLDLLAALQPVERRRPLRWLGVGALVVGGAAAWSLSGSDPCADRGFAADTYAAKATTVLGRLGDGGEAAREVRVVADAWNALDGATCVAHAQQRLSSALYELRSRCLERALVAGSDALDTVSTGEYGLPEARRTLAQVLDVSRCEDDEGLLLGAPDAGYDVEAGEAIQRQIDRAYVFHTLGDDARWLELLEETQAELHDRDAVLPDALWLAMQLGDALTRAGRLEDAHDVLMSALVEAKSHPKLGRTVAMLQVQLAKVALQKRDLEKAELWITLAKPILSSLPQQQHAYAAAVVHSSISVQAEKFKDALAHADEADRIAEAAGPAASSWAGADVLAAELLVGRCAAHSGIGQHSDALAACEAARQGFASAGVRSGRTLATALNTHAVALRRVGKTTAAVDLYERAAKTYKDASFPEGAATVLINLANVLDAGGDYAAALGAYADAERALGRSRGPAWISLHFNRGIARFAAQDWDGAADDATKALECSRELGSTRPSDLYDYEVLLGTAEAKRGRVDEAKETLLRAVRHEREQHDPYSKAELRIALAGLVDEKTAAPLCEAAVQFATESGDRNLKTEAERCVSASGEL